MEKNEHKKQYHHLLNFDSENTFLVNEERIISDAEFDFNGQIIFTKHNKNKPFTKQIQHKYSIPNPWSIKSFMSKIDGGDQIP